MLSLHQRRPPGWPGTICPWWSQSGFISALQCIYINVKERNPWVLFSCRKSTAVKKESVPKLLRDYLGNYTEWFRNYFGSLSSFFYRVPLTLNCFIISVSFFMSLNFRVLFKLVLCHQIKSQALVFNIYWFVCAVNFYLNATRPQCAAFEDTANKGPETQSSVYTMK